MAARGTLRIYLGAAPGVGKTYAMLGEGRRRSDRGTDVVVGVVETHGRAQTLAQMGDLEVVPRAVVEYRGAAFEEMDVDALLARKPEVALVDELAHTNVPGLAQREALAGRRGAARRRDHRRLDAEHPASRVPQRRRGADHRDHAARDDPRRDRPARRPDRARRHEPRGAPPAHGPRERLPGRAGRRRARQLLPGREPRRAARARAPLGGRPRRRGPRRVPPRPRDRAPVGDARAGTGRADRRRRRRPPRPARRAHGTAGEGRPRRGARPLTGRPDDRGLRCPRGPADAGREPGRDVPGRRRRRRRQSPCRHGAAHERHADRARRHPAVAADRAPPRVGDPTRDPGLGRGGRRPRHQPCERRTGEPRAPPPDEPSRAPGGRRGASRGSGPPCAHGRPGCAPGRPRAAQRAAPLPPRRRRRRGRRRHLAGARGRDRGLPPDELVLHASPLHVHDRRGREPPRTRDLPRRRGDREWARLPRRTSRERGTARACGGGDPRAAGGNLERRRDPRVDPQDLRPRRRHPVASSRPRLGGGRGGGRARRAWRGAAARGRGPRARTRRARPFRTTSAGCSTRS